VWLVGGASWVSANVVLWVDYLFLAEIENLGLNDPPRLGSQFQAKKSLDS
jgi:hypothetical protein